MEYPLFGISRRYAEALNYMWMAFFFYNIMPFCLVYTVIGLIILYWLDKYNILRKRVTRVHVSH